MIGGRGSTRRRGDNSSPRKGVNQKNNGDTHYGGGKRRAAVYFSSVHAWRMTLKTLVMQQLQASKVRWAIRSSAGCFFVVFAVYYCFLSGWTLWGAHDGRGTSSDFIPGRGIADLRSMGYQSRPRAMGYYFLPSGTVHGAQRLFTYYERYPSKRQIVVTEREVEAQKLLEKSKHYRRAKGETFETSECKAQYRWQLMSFPNCNNLHETDINDLRAEREEDEWARIVNNGFWRDVWMVRDSNGDKSALKTLRYEHDFLDRNYDRHRRDALAMERLTSSPNVVDIYGYCGNSGISEYTSSGDINDAVWPLDAFDNDLTKLDKLRIATQVSVGVADTHNIDLEGRSSIAHTDITPSQFILIDGIYKLNDFNRCRFIRWNKVKDEPCPYKVGRNPGKFRSPEEYEYGDQTEQVDVYSMGNIFYAILTELWPFEGMKEKLAVEKIKDGERPPINETIQSSTHPVDIALMKAMAMCWKHDADERASARQVQQYLAGELKKYESSQK